MNVFRFAEAPWHASEGRLPTAVEPAPAALRSEPPRGSAYAGAPIVSAIVGRQAFTPAQRLPLLPLSHHAGIASTPRGTYGGVRIPVPEIRTGQQDMPTGETGARLLESIRSRSAAQARTRDGIETGLRGGSPGDRLEAGRQDLLRKRDAQYRMLADLASSERDIQVELERMELDIQGLQAEIAALRERGADPGTHERMLALTQDRLTQWQNLLRDARTAQRATMGELRATQRDLEVGAQLRQQNVAGPSGAGRS
jgi:hypothetical protein